MSPGAQWAIRAPAYSECRLSDLWKAPQASEGRRKARYYVALDNRSNSPLEAEVLPVDPTGQLKFQVHPPRLEAEADTSAFSELIAIPRLPQPVAVPPLAPPSARRKPAAHSASIKPARSLPHPVTTSLFATIYDQLPNDTDLTVFKRAQRAGINFAYIGGGTQYHTPLDNFADVVQSGVRCDGSGFQLRHIEQVGDEAVETL